MSLPILPAENATWKNARLAQKGFGGMQETSTVCKECAGAQQSGLSKANKHALSAVQAAGLYQHLREHILSWLRRV